VNEFLWPVRVYYEDTDSGGVVYYANYLKFMERARTEWLRSLGFEQDALRAQERLIFAVRTAQVDYLRPARFNDHLSVQTAIRERGGASLLFAHAIRRGDELLCAGEIKVVSLEAETLRPRRLPAAIAQRLEEMGL
jgi:acyl-CoA thioester hydrolase